MAGFDWIIIDGNNLIHSGRERYFDRAGFDFPGARRQLVALLDELSGELASRLTVVFDGTIGGRDESLRAEGPEVLFSPQDLTADSVIERMVAGAGDPGKILVVTSDRAEIQTVTVAGGQVMSCKSFLDLIDETQQTLKRRLANQSKSGPRATLGDFFPGRPSRT